MPVGITGLFSARKYTQNSIFSTGKSLFGFDLNKLTKGRTDNRTDGCDFGV